MSNGKIFILDEAVTDNYDDSSDVLFPLTRREAIMLLSQIDFIGWHTRWKDKTYSLDYLQAKVASIADGLMNPQEASMIQDCEDVEDCVEVSTTIINIQNETTNNTTAISNNTTQVTEQGDTINELVEQSVYNIYPPAPEQATEPDAFCGTAWYIAEYLESYIQDVITDAATITFQEFVQALLGIGGFKASLAKALWDFIIVNVNPNLSTEVSDAIENVATAFYCGNLSIDLAKTEIENDAGITSDAEAAYIAAIDSLTTSKYSELIYLGSLDESRDCSTFCPAEWENVLDLSIEQYEAEALLGNYIAGNYIQSDSSSTDALLQVRLLLPQSNLTYIEVEYTASGNAGYVKNLIAYKTPSGSNEVILTTPTGAGVSSITADMQGVTDILVNMQDADQNKVFRVSKLTIRGTGINPMKGVTT